MQTIAIISVAGGAGRTTLTATLAALLCARGRPVLALDLDPRNQLGMQLGLPLDEADGLAPQLLAQGVWRQAAFQNSDGVRILPFGRVSAQQLPLLDAIVLQSPDWLRQQLAQLALPADAVVLIDTPRLPSQYAQQAIAAADLSLDVLLPDAAALGAARHAELATGNGRVYHLLNQLESARPLQRDVMQLLRSALGERIAPYPLHRDPSLPEAVARNCSHHAYAPHAQAAHDLQGLASWLTGLLERPAAAP